MRVGWVTAVEDRRIASFRYRVEAPAAGLRARGHKVELLDPALADSYDVIVFSKAYSAEHRALAKSVKRRGGRVVFDICDNHFYNPFDLPKYRRARDDINEMMSLADRVICSTSTLAGVVREEMGGGVEPMVVGDVVERYRVRTAPPTAEGPLRLTWFGSHGSPNAPSGMSDLLLIRKELEALAAHHPVELTVCSNSREKFEQIVEPMRVPSRYVEWSLESFPDLLAQTDAAILPMTINPFTACKTHNRLTTALYAGVPVVASGIESYREFDRYCTLDDWTGGLEAIVLNRDEEGQRALRSREHIDERWTTEALSAQWEAALALPLSMPAPASRLNGLRLQGRLDAVARRSVTGWVRAPLKPDLQLQVVLECDGEPVAMTLASAPRPDLQKAGVASDCGFALPLPPRLVGAAISRLTVRVLESGWVVGENPILLAEDDHASFAPNRLGAAPLSLRGVFETQPEERWDVNEAITAQERLLAELEQESAKRPRPQADAQAASPRRSNQFRQLLRSGADSQL
ncbi:MAG: hypothetical protein B7Y99_03070 [Caulobacterales bacterium 32-69-10]|nr:MAG: hypothetical protein B7Y99_03070 [Caulobacterales bacterium 32-69-10]